MNVIEHGIYRVKERSKQGGQKKKLSKLNKVENCRRRLKKYKPENAIKYPQQSGSDTQMR